MIRKYTNITVSKHVYVTSTGHYEARVMWTGGMAYYALGMGLLTTTGYTWDRAPKYLVSEAQRLIAEMFRDGSAKFYEYDRDHNKRYDNLRYHDPEVVAWWAERLSPSTSQVTP